MPSFLLLVLLPWMLLLAILVAERPWGPFREGQGSPPPLAPSESIVLPADGTPLRLNWHLALAPALAIMMAIQAWPWTAQAPRLLLCGIAGLPVLWFVGSKENRTASKQLRQMRSTSPLADHPPQPFKRNSTCFCSLRVCLSARTLNVKVTVN